MDAAREVDIILNFLAETEEARALNEEMQEMIRNAQEAAEQARIMGDRYGDGYRRWRHEQSLLSEEARALQREMRYGWMENSEGFRRALNDMVFVEYGFYRLARAGQEFAGTTDDLMNSLRDLGAEQRRINDEMINNNMRLRASIYQTAATMMNMSTQAERITANYERMGNPMYLVNRGNLAIAEGLNRIAMNGNAAVLALEMLGPTASTRELNNMIMMINQGLMRFAFVGIGAALSGLVLYYVMHQLAMQHEEYANSLETMIETIIEAIQPMVKVFIAIATTIFNFVTAVGKIVIAFNEAHPAMAMFIQGTMLLIPLLTLILSPLAIGIGLLAGYRAAWAMLWTFIGPLITGLAAMSTTVWIVSAAIVGLTMVIVALWRNNEGFRNAVIGAWESIKATAMAVFGFLAPYITQAAQAIMNAFKMMGEAVGAAFSGDFSKLSDMFMNIIPTLITVIVGGIPGLIMTAARILPSFEQGLTSSGADVGGFFTDIIQTIINSITTAIPAVANAAMAIIQALTTAIVTNGPAIGEAFSQMFANLISLIGALLPQIATVVVQLVQALVEGIATVLPVLIEAALGLIMMLIETIVTLLPMLVELGIQIIMALIQAIIEALPMLIEAAISIIDALISGITELLPMILELGVQLIMSLLIAIVEALPMIMEAGMQIVMALIDGLVTVLPLIITAAINLVISLTVAIIGMLPLILSTGIQLTLMLISGIIQLVPTLIATGISLVVSIVTAILTKIPDMISAGVKLLTGLITGIISIVGNLISTAATIGSDLVGKFKEIDLMQVGKDIINGLIGGIKSMAGAAVSAAKDVAGSVADSVKGLFKIASPSRLMREYGGFISQGLAIGITHDAPKVDKATLDMASGVTNQINTYSNQVATDVTDDAVQAGNYNVGGDVTHAPVFNLTFQGNESSSGASRSEIEDVVDESLNQYFNRYITTYES